MHETSQNKLVQLIPKLGIEYYYDDGTPLYYTKDGRAGSQFKAKKVADEFADYVEVSGRWSRAKREILRADVGEISGTTMRILPPPIDLSKTSSMNLLRNIPSSLPPNANGPQKLPAKSSSGLEHPLTKLPPSISHTS